MELLAETLRSVRTEACDAVRREDSITARLERAKLIADELILELPVFLRSVSAERESEAYICQLCCGFGFTPYAGFTKDEMPESMRDPEGKTISTTAHCYKYFFGIPRFFCALGSQRRNACAGWVLERARFRDHLVMSEIHQADIRRVAGISDKASFFRGSHSCRSSEKAADCYFN